MRLPRDLSGRDLAKALSRLGYRIIHETGSHIRLFTERIGQHHVTVPDHPSISVGTLGTILRDLQQHHQLQRDELLEKLFG